MTPAQSAIKEGLEAYLRPRWRDVQALTVVSVDQIPGGASRETFRVGLRYEQDGRAREVGVILRRDPVSSLIDTERSLEYNTYRAVHGTDIPVPEPLVLEEDPCHLARPFSLMREVTGCQTNPQSFATPAFEGLRQSIGEQKWTLLGKLAALDPIAIGAADFMTVPALDACAAEQLAYWEGVINADALHPQPIAQAAIRWLKRQSPPPAQRLALVHGDYRSGNFLYDGDGKVHGILDWEMAHLGDPLEDLAWSLDPLWSWPGKHLAGGLLPRADAVRIWQAASGLAVDPEAFRWWQVFASVKAVAIWISSTEDFANGISKEPILAVAGWIMTDREDRILVDRLSPVSRHRYAEPLE